VGCLLLQCRVPKEKLGAVTEVLRQLCVGSDVTESPQPSQSPGNGIKSLSSFVHPGQFSTTPSRHTDLRSLSSLLLQPEAAFPSLTDLSQRDCEVNAPLDRDNLLQGPDLLNALDSAESLAV